jgi:seryl-tRNA synthetase
MSRDEIIGHDELPLTYDQVTEAFRRSEPALLESKESSGE